MSPEGTQLDVDILREIRSGLGALVLLIERELGPERAALWSRPDPVALVAEVYGGLALPIQLLDRLIRQVAEPEGVALPEVHSRQYERR